MYTDVSEVGCAGLDWIYLAQHKNKRRAVVSTVMDLGSHKMWKIL